MIFLITAGFILLTLPDLPAIIKNRKWKELAVYSVIFVIAFIYALRLALDMPLFSPVEMLKNFFDKTLGLNYDNWH